MQRKNLLKMMIPAILIGVMVAASGSVCPAAETYTLTSLTAWPKNALESQQFIKFLELTQKEADEKYPGELKLVYKGAGEVIRNTEQVEALRTGLIDMDYVAASYYTSIMPEIDTMSLTTMTPWEERKAGVNDYLEKLHNAKANAHYLGRVGTGSLFHLFLAKPIKTVDDLKGFKIRCSPTTIPFMKSVGAEPVGMPPPDIYTAMERGVVDGYILPPATIKDFGLVKPSKYMVFPGFYQPVIFILVNLDKWNQLPAHLQELLTRQAEACAHYFFKNIADELQKDLGDFQKEGMTFIKLDPPEAKKFSKMAYDALLNTVMKKAPEESAKIRDLITK